MTSGDIYLLLIARNIDLLLTIWSDNNAETFVVTNYMFYTNDMG